MWGDASYGIAGKSVALGCARNRSLITLELVVVVVEKWTELKFPLLSHMAGVHAIPGIEGLLLRLEI